jgi:hypothetical protein
MFNFHFSGLISETSLTATKPWTPYFLVSMTKRVTALINASAWLIQSLVDQSWIRPLVRAVGFVVVFYLLDYLQILCKATSEPTIKDDFFHLVYVSELTNTARMIEEQTSVDTLAGSGHSVRSSVSKPARTPERRAAEDNNIRMLNFGKFLRRCMSTQPYCCPSNRAESKGESDDNTFKLVVPDDDKHTSKRVPRVCPPGSARTQCYCLEPPLALAVSLVWSIARETAEVIGDLLSVITYSIKASDFFHSDGINSPPASPAESSGPTYVFRGMVCYYGMHYVSIFQEYSPGEPRFLLFDDSNIRCLGTWNSVKAECVKSMYQPVLLLYELENLMDLTDSLSDMPVDLTVQPTVAESKAESRAVNDKEGIAKRTVLVNVNGTKTEHLLADDKLEPSVSSSADDHHLLTTHDRVAHHGSHDTATFAHLMDATSPRRIRSQSSTKMLNEYASADESIRRAHSVQRLQKAARGAATSPLPTAGAQPAATRKQGTEVTVAAPGSLSSPLVSPAIQNRTASMSVRSPAPTMQPSSHSPLKRIYKGEIRQDVFTVSLGEKENKGVFGYSGKPGLLGFNFEIDSERRVIVTGRSISFLACPTSLTYCGVRFVPRGRGCNIACRSVRESLFDG